MATKWTRKGPLYTGKSGLKQRPDGTWVEDFEQYKKDNPGVNLDRVKNTPGKKLLIASAKKRRRRK